MARRTRSASLENRTNRLKLSIRKKPFGVLIAPGIHLCYRSNAGPGTWSVKCNGWLRRFALADDHEDANNASVMSYWEALEQAKKLARAGEGNSEQPISVSAAVDDYESDLKTRGGRKYNATQLRLHLTDAMNSKAVALLAERELRDWRAGLVKKGLKPSSADRIARSLKAALAFAARNDKRITNTSAWRNRAIPPLSRPYWPGEDASCRCRWTRMGCKSNGSPTDLTPHCWSIPLHRTSIRLEPGLP